MVKVGIKLLDTYDREWTLPRYSHIGDSGMDVKSTVDYNLKSKERFLIPTGICVEIPEGYEIQIRPRSGLALKNGITVLNTPGTIDSGYRNEIGILLINLSKEVFEIKRGDRIAQFVIQEVIKCKWELKNLSETGRGLGGFGSTGI